MEPSTIAIIILVCVLTSFVANKIPLGLTATLGALAMAIFGVMDYREVYAGFGSTTLMMVIGVTVIGNTLFETGCAQIMGKAIVGIKGAGNNEKIFLAVIILTTTVLSAFVSNTATVAMMIPLIGSVAAASKGRITKKNTLMAMGIASIVGGNATLAGSTPQMIAQGILGETEGLRTLTFFELVKGTIPQTIVLMLYFATVGYRLQIKVFDFEETISDSSGSEKMARIDKRKAAISALIFLGCVVGFVTGWADFGTVALLAACMCVLTGCISVKRLWETMDWRTVTVLGGSLGFAKGMQESGAIQMIADKLLPLLGGENASPWLISFMLVLLCSIMGNVMSHTATAAIMTPFAIALGMGMGVNPIPLVIMVIIGCNTAFATPISTPPLTMVLAGGYRFNDYVKVGGLLNVLEILIAVITIPLLYGLV